VRASGEVAVQDRDGEWVRGELRDGSFVAPWLTLVRWRPEGRRLDRTVLLIPGMAAEEELRRLRILLRWA
jgi:toxin CptA